MLTFANAAAEGADMHSNVKVAIIIAVGLVIAVLAYQYFSPFSQCVRALEAAGHNTTSANLRCAKELNARQ